MKVRILDLDGSLPRQQRLFAECQPTVIDLRSWGPGIRLACSFGRFRRFEQELAQKCPRTEGRQPVLTFYGSGDFHHVSLALLRRQTTPINLLVLDNHPDWMRGVPFLHCGTWLLHAAQLPCVARIFHVGGDVDFDNYYQCLAPWRWLRAGKIVVLPARRHFQRGLWRKVAHEPVRTSATSTVGRARLRTLLEPFGVELARRPLYISLDKDVLRAEDAIVNWDSGHLSLAEVGDIAQAFLAAAQGKLAGIDILGDWSPIRLRGGLRHFMHWTEHPALTVDPDQARERNQQTNARLLEMIRVCQGATMQATA